MEKLTDIKQLKEGTKFIIMDGDKCTYYTFLCIHPNNKKYILAIESSSQEGKMLFIPTLLGDTGYFGQVYVGEYDFVFINQKKLEYHKKEVEFYTKRVQEELARIK